MTYNIQSQSGSVNPVLEMLNNNKLLIGSLVVAGGAAIFLFATDSGKRLRGEIQDRAEELYDVVSEQVKIGIAQSREAINKMLSQIPDEETSKPLDKVA